MPTDYRCDNVSLAIVPQISPINFISPDDIFFLQGFDSIQLPSCFVLGQQYLKDNKNAVLQTNCYFFVGLLWLPLTEPISIHFKQPFLKQAQAAPKMELFFPTPWAAAVQKDITVSYGLFRNSSIAAGPVF